MRDFKYLCLIVLISVAAAIETDIYLPAFKDMQLFFAASESTMQLILSINFFGICLSSLIIGPIADAVGRRKPLVFSLSVFFAASLGCSFAQSIEMLLMARFFQGIGSGGCFTLGTAVIFDVFKGDKAVAIMGVLNSTISMLMAGAPLVGGFINAYYGFWANFHLITFLVGGSLLLVALMFVETIPKEKLQPLAIKHIGRSFLQVASSPIFWAYNLVVAMIFSGYLVYVSNIALLFPGSLGVEMDHLPFYQVAVLGAFVLASLFTNRIQRAFGGKMVQNSSLSCLGLGAVAFLLSACLDPMHAIAFTVSMMVFSFGAGLGIGIYFAEGMSVFPELRGYAASLVTSFRLCIAALIAWASGLLYDGTSLRLSLIVLACALLAILSGLYTKLAKHSAAA